MIDNNLKVHLISIKTAQKKLENSPKEYLSLNPHAVEDESVMNDKTTARFDT